MQQIKKGLANAMNVVLNNPYVDILGHPDDGRYEYDYEQIATLAKENNKIIEVNNASLRPRSVRQNARENDFKLLEACAKYNVPVIIGSDAHISYDVAAHEMALDLVKESAYPEEQLLNFHPDTFQTILAKHKEEWYTIKH